MDGTPEASVSFSRTAFTSKFAGLSTGEEPKMNYEPKIKYNFHGGLFRMLSGIHGLILTPQSIWNQTFWFASLVILATLSLSGCGVETLSLTGPSPIDWTYQDGERRVNFKHVKVTTWNGRKIIRGTVENVGEDPWPNPRVHFRLLDQNMKPIGTASASRVEPLDVSSAWTFRVIPERGTIFHRARFLQPTGW